MVCCNSVISHAIEQPPHGPTHAYLCRIHVCVRPSTHQSVFAMLQIVEHYSPVPSKILLHCDEGGPA